MFDRVLHCDWSTAPGGRWSAEAQRHGGRWVARAPRPVGPLAPVLDDLLRGDRVLAAFDLPIGLPEAYARRTGLADFRAALAAFGTAPWGDVLAPATRPEEIGLGRPFYPARPGGARRAHLVEGLGLASWSEVLRLCDRGGAGRVEAGALFWLVGAKCVGKAAIHAWTAMLRPALARGAALWPFDGALTQLAAKGGAVIAESYPADALRQLELSVRGKQNPTVLAAAGPALLAAAARHGIVIEEAAERAVLSGFAAHGRRCGDAFDAFVGLIAAVPVAEGTTPDGAPALDAVRRWEGWILGRT